jgi:hypothetical protein
MTTQFVTSDPRTGGGLVASVGATVYYVTGGAATELLKYGTGNTEWCTKPTNGAGRPVTSDPRSGGGLSGPVGDVVMYVTGGAGTLLVKYGTAATAWVPVPMIAGVSAIGHGHVQNDVTGLVADLAGKSPTVHSHAQSDVTDLVGDLAAKSDVGHTHAGSDLAGFAAGRVPFGDGAALTTDAAFLFDSTNDILTVGTPSGTDPQLVAAFSRFGAAADAFLMIEAGTAKDPGVWFIADDANLDGAIFLDYSDGKKLKIALGDVNSDADRQTATKVWIEQDGDTGIGVTPGAKLHAKETTTGLGVARFEHSHAAGYAGAEFVDSAAAYQYGVGYGNASVGVTYLRQVGYLYSATSKNFVIANPTRAEHTFGMTAGQAFYEIHAGGDAGVSTASRLRLKYSSTLNQLLASRNAGAYGNVDARAWISPAALASGSTNNWNPSHVPGSLIRATPDAAASTVTGLVALADASAVTVVNIGTTNLILNHEDGASTAANRFLLPGSANLTLTPNASAALRYDGTSARWRFCP